jgi:hypothetical protein
VLLRELRWRHPSRFEELFANARNALIARGERVSADEVFELSQDIHFLMRLTPELRDHVEPAATNQRALDVANTDDKGGIESMLLQHEGEESVATYRRWFARQPERFLVVRTPKDPVAAFAASIRIDAAAFEDPDPRIKAVACHARTVLGAGPGHVLYSPFWMAREGYHAIDETRLALGAALGGWLLAPNIALAYVHVSSSEAAIAALERTGARAIRQLAFRHREVDQLVFLYDRRGLTAQQWSVRSLRAMGAPPQAQAAAAPPSVPLDRAGFENELRAALRTLHDLSQLRKNRLVDARFVGTPAGTGPRATLLRAALLERIESLRGAPHGERQYAAMRASFVDPAENQELAAERCAMSYSTFRRYLASGVVRLVEDLWSVEIDEMRRR